MMLTTSRQMFVRLEFSAIYANDIYQRQGIDSNNEWTNFDKDGVVSLLCLVRRPSDGGNGDMVSLKQRSIYSLPCSSSITISTPSGQ